jgi:DNA-binding transcriptional ArsR family regulator
VTVALGDPAAHVRLVGPTARARLRRQLDRLPVSEPAAFRPLDVVPSGAGEVVLCGALCGVDDLDAAVHDLRRAVGADGRLVFLEHVRRPGMTGMAQSAAGAVLARLPGGCRPDRDVPAALRRAGFVVTDLERFTMPTPLLALRPWVRGVAVPRREPRS